MLNLFLLNVLVGAVLGMRLKVWILIPAIGFFVIGIVGIGMARGDGSWSIASTLVLAAILLQFGYLAGSTTRFVIAAASLPRRVYVKTTGRQGDRQTLPV